MKLDEHKQVSSRSPFKSSNTCNKMSSTVQVEKSLLEALFSSIVSQKEKTQPTVEVQPPAVVENVAAIKSKISNDKKIARYFKTHYKYGHYMSTKQNADNSLDIRPSAPEVVNNIVVHFNKKPQVVLTRTHGRTTLTERLEIALFAKCVKPNVVAQKFSVSLPTVYFYTKAYSHLV